jgi:hypothetical protein
MLKITLLGLGLFVGSLFAQDNLNKISSTTLGGYSASISSQNKIASNGINPIEITVYNKGKILLATNLNLTLYTPDNKTIEYKQIKDIDNHYITEINFTEKGEYNYVIRFDTQTGGVAHYLRGRFKV